MPALTDFDIPSLSALFTSWGHKPSHAARLLREFYLAHGKLDPNSLLLGRELRARLAFEIIPRQSRVITTTDSSDGTLKLLVGFTAGGAVEAVLMPSHHPERAAGCVSTQVGCAMGCDFCASTRNGLTRDLSAGEIVEQFLHLREHAQAQHRRLTRLVYMGMGEPLHNTDAVLASIDRIASLGNLGYRNITVSTVGIVPGIDRLADANLGIHLAVSLHAPDDATRAAIIPTGKKYRVADIMTAAKRFQSLTRRIVTIEYTMLAGVNDSDEQAHALADLMAGFRAHVNLIPYNPTGPGLSGRIYLTPPLPRMQRFLEILTARRVVAHFRRTRGDDANAACGQLAQTYA